MADLYSNISPLTESPVPEARPTEWWQLRAYLFSAVQKAVGQFKLEGEDHLPEEVADYTTDAMLSRKDKLLSQGKGNLLGYAYKVAFNRVSRLQQEIKKNTALRSEYISVYYAKVLVDADCQTIIDLICRDNTPEQLLSIMKDICKLEEFSILYMRFYRRNSYVEIAKQLDMNLDTVKSHARRGLQSLLDHFSKNNTTD